MGKPQIAENSHCPNAPGGNAVAHSTGQLIPAGSQSHFQAGVAPNPSALLSVNPASEIGVAWVSYNLLKHGPGMWNLVLKWQQSHI